MHSLLLLLKNKFEKVGKFRPIVISKRAHNRTSVFVFRNLKTGEMIVKFPGECKSFVENTLHGGQTCEACGRKKAKKAKESQRRKRPHWRNLGICQVCGKREAIEGQSWCGVCAERHCTRKSRA